MADIEDICWGRNCGLTVDYVDRFFDEFFLGLSKVSESWGCWYQDIFEDVFLEFRW